MKKLLFILSLFISATAFAQVPLAGYVTTIGPSDTYPVTLDSLQAGGYTTTYNYTTRNAIPAERRKISMQVRYSSNMDSTFVLSGGITNNDWVYTGSGNSIQNQNASAQAANFWISGGGRIDGGLSVYGNTLLYSQTNLYNTAMAFFGSNPVTSPSIFINSGGIKIGTTGNLTNNYTEYTNNVIKIDNGSTLFYNYLQPKTGTVALLSDIAANGITLNEKLYTWTNSFSYSLTAITRDSNDGIVSATIIWPDGSTGAFTTDTSSTDFPGAVDAYHVTYIPASGPTKTITQSLLTRNTNGAVTAQPILTIAP